MAWMLLINNGQFSHSILRNIIAIAGLSVRGESLMGVWENPFIYLGADNSQIRNQQRVEVLFIWATIIDFL